MLYLLSYSLPNIRSRKTPDCGGISPLPAARGLKSVLGLLTIGLLSLADISSIAQAAADPVLPAQVLSLPMQFEKNAGQTDPQVEYLARGPGYTLFLTPTRAVFSLSPAKGSGGAAKRAGQHQSNNDVATLEMNLVGANPHPSVEGLDQLPGKTSYFLGNNPENWHVGVPTYARIQYHDVYPGIDLIYYGNHRQLEYDFIVAPGANAKRIGLKIEGADKLEVDSQGDLVAHIHNIKVSWNRPHVYQETEGGRKQIIARFVLKKNQRIGFEVGAYDPAKPLIIDPALVYSTYLGGTGDEFTFNSFAPNGVKIALDTNGNVFVVGQTLSRNFPTRNAYDSTANGADTNLCDVFITKFNASGSSLIYSTYLGGISNDVAGDIAIDSAGNAYITGSTESPDFPHINAFQSVNNGLNDIFVTKLSSNGTSIVYSTFLGGSVDDFGRAIAVDSSGSAYITGKSWSKGTGNPPYPTSHGAYQTDNGGGNNYSSDAIVAKFDSTGSLIYSTFLGGSSEEEGNGIAVDTAGNAYVVGQVLSTTAYPSIPDSDFPIFNAFQPSFNNGGTNLIFLYDGFLTKLNATGTGLIFSTFLGGEEDDTVTGITLDSKGRIYVTGSTSSSSFPSTPDAVQINNAGADLDPEFPGSDAFITIFETNGTSLVYSTYLGGTDFEEGDSIRLNRFDIAVDNFNCVYIVGQTTSFDFPLTTGADQTNSEAGNDVFVAKINPAVPGPAGLIYSTLLSGSIGLMAGGALNEAEGIAVDANGNFYVAGITTATNFPVTAGAYATTNKGGYDVFVTKYASPRDLSVVMLASTNNTIVGSNITYTIQINNNGRAPFTGVTNLVQISSNAPIISASSTAGNISTNAGIVTLNIGNMTNNASITETVVIGAPSPGVFTNTATVTGIETATLEPNTDNNVSSFISTIQGIADARITSMSASPNPVIVGSNLTYTITVGNKGPWPATSVVLTDTLPASVTFVSAVTNASTTYTYDTNNPGIVAFSFSNLLLTNGGSATVMINVTPTAPGVIQNNASISAFELDQNPANNSSSVSTTVNALADVGVGLTGPTTGMASSNLTYTLRVTNYGPYAASSTIATETIPAGASYVTATTSQGSVATNNGVVTWTLGNIGSNGVATLTLTLKANSDGLLSNTVSVTNSTATDLVMSNNSATLNTAVGPAADIALSQAITAGTALVTSNFTVTVTLTNQGPSISTNIVLTDSLPAGLSLQSFQAPPGSSSSQANGLITCNIPSLVNGAAANLTLNFYAAVDGSFTNTASVSAGTPDLNPNNSSSLTINVLPNPNAPLLKATRSGSKVVLYWSTNAVGYSLQSRTNFSPANSWGALTNTRTIGAQIYSTNDTSAGTSFYRLIK